MNYKTFGLFWVASILFGCSSNPIEKPPALQEYQHPFANTQYQAKPATVTQLTIENPSDVADIVSEPEYVYWSSNSPSMLELTQTNDTKHQPAEVPVQNDSAVEVHTNSKPTVNKIKKTIYCDADFSSPCGELDWCNDTFCNQRLAQFYQCNEKGCVPLYILNKDKHCTEPYSSIDPYCMGKGDTSCALHPELNYCNTKLE